MKSKAAKIIMLLAVVMMAMASSCRAQADSVRVSLLTCMPGQEIYALCGHSALRVQSEKGDSIWNYGLFSFEQPNFVYRFVKGETDYMVGAYPTSWFLPEYGERGSRVYEQELLLSEDEKRSLLEHLRNDLEPQNRTYRYNYIKNNCATRIRDHIEAVTGPVLYTDTLLYGSYRNEMRAHHRNYPWYQFGIDLALGSGLDGNITSRDEMFSPDEMMRRFATSKRMDGRPLTAPATIIVEGSDAAILPATPMWATPLFVSWVLFFGTLFAAWLGWRRGYPIKWIYALVYGLWGLAGCLIAFLVFVSTHEATSPNMLIVWLNPLQLLVPIFIWSRRTRPVVTVMMWYNLVLVGIMLLLWGFGKQSANPAFFPLMGMSVILALAWMTARSAQRITYNGQRKASRRDVKTRSKTR